MVILPNRRKFMVGVIPSGATVPMSECVVTLASDNVQYTGSARTVGVAVTWGTTELEVNTDYTLSWANNVNVGPATVTVTGMGQFSGSVIKTFYVVVGSAVPWAFNLSDATLADELSLSGGIQYELPLVENYDGGAAVLPMHQWANNAYLIGRTLSRDENDEYHLTNLASSSFVLDGSGISGSLHPFHFSRSQSGWYGNDPLSKVLKMKSSGGVSSFDFADALSENIQVAPYFANGGRMIFIFGGSYKIYSFVLSNPYDITTVDVESRKVVDRFLGVSGYNRCQSCNFSPDGLEAIVTVTGSGVVYHVSLSEPYDLSGATSIGSLTTAMGGTCILSLTNGGKTLILGNSSKIYEYSLVQS